MDTPTSHPTASFITALAPVIAAEFFIEERPAQVLAAAYLLARPEFALPHGVYAPAAAVQISLRSLLAVLPTTSVAAVTTALRYARRVGLLDYGGCLTDPDVARRVSHRLRRCCELELAYAQCAGQEGG